MTYLFTPPQRTDYAVLEGSLRAKVYVSWTVWKDPTLGWQTLETPPGDTILAAIQALPGTPSLVDNTTATSLLAWIATLVPGTNFPQGIALPTCVFVS